MKEPSIKLRTLIVDDEPPARDLIATLLRGEPDVEIVGECSNGRSAATAIDRLSPDLVFLDVQMPGLDGFGVIAELKTKCLPLVVFVTAFDQYAVRAFEAHALDYLLKPFEFGRLRHAVERARLQLGKRRDTYEARLRGLLEELESRNQSWKRIAVREPGRTLFLDPDDIDWVEAEGNYVRLHAGKESYLLRETMHAAEERLATMKFLRISRSTLVNLERVVEWQPMFHGDSVLILRDGTRLSLSRMYRESFNRLAGQIG